MHSYVHLGDRHKDAIADFYELKVHDGYSLAYFNIAVWWLKSCKNEVAI